LTKAEKIGIFALSMMTLLAIVGSTFMIACCVFFGAFFMFFKNDTLNHIVIFLVSLSAGAMMGGAFLHLLPEALEMVDAETAFKTFLCAFVMFFLIEKILHWRHCHQGDCTVHPFGYMNLIGDGIHNFIDGLVLASTFMIDIRLGITTTLAVALHEIPQEIGDYGVLVHSGFKKSTALFLNFLIALIVVAGGIFGYFFFSRVDSVLPYLLPFAAGGFVYIAASDLMPEMKKETDFKKSAGVLLVFIAGILMMLLVKE
jgi:zinc and cadmium transporter